MDQQVEKDLVVANELSWMVTRAMNDGCSIIAIVPFKFRLDALTGEHRVTEYFILRSRPL